MKTVGLAALIGATAAAADVEADHRPRDHRRGGISIIIGQPFRPWNGPHGYYEQYGYPQGYYANPYQGYYVPTCPPRTQAHIRIPLNRRLQLEWHIVQPRQGDGYIPSWGAYPYYGGW